MDEEKVQVEIQESGNGGREKRRKNIDREQQSDDRRGVVVLGREGRD